MCLIKKHIFTPVFFVAVLFFSFQGPLAHGQLPDSRQEVLSRLERMEAAYPQQKVFIHTDKEEYLAGENIWMKGYVVNATTHRPDTLSNNLYVELINTDGQPVSILLLRLQNGIAHGDITLPDSLSEGNYQMRAFTNWMNNFDEDLFFTKDIYVYNPIEENFIRRWDVWKNRRFNRRIDKEQENMQFAFFPEGGNLISGLENRVAFKATNALGAGVSASGILLDNQGKEILEFSSHYNGMGYFSFVPEQGKSYEAVVTFENGNESDFKMPKAQPTGYLLFADLYEEDIRVTVKANFPAMDENGYDDVFLLVQGRGRPLFLEKRSFNDHLLTHNFPLDVLPSGISQITLLNTKGKPLAQRLVFVNHKDIKKLDYIDSNVNVQEEAQTEVTIQFNDKVNFSDGNYSIAVIDSDKNSEQYDANIVTELLLSSDLGYVIEDPWFYFKGDPDIAGKAMDLVMLTHGWRRFDLEKVIAGEFPEIKYGFPNGISIGGKVSPRSSGRETGMVNVELSVYQDEVDIYNTETDRKGNFLFPNLDYEGYFTANMRVDRRYDTRAMRIDMDSRSLDELQYQKNFNTRKKQVTSRGDEWERVSRPETVMKSRGLIEPSRGGVSIYSDPDQVIYFEDIRRQHNSIMDVLRTRVRGLRVVGGEIMLRGPSSFRFSNEPVFMVDEVMVDRSTFLNTSIQEVERLEVISGPGSAILGSRGANGALLIYTLRGDDHRHRSYEYLLKGFHIPSETFETKINSDVHKRNNIQRTLLWEPYINPDSNGNVSFSFSTDEFTRDVRVIIQGIDENGRITFSEQWLDAEKPIN